MHRTAFALLAASFFVAIGCSSSNDSPVAAQSPPTDAGADVAAPPPPPTGDRDASPPPARPDVRQLVKLSGPVLANPVVVPLFWGDDADRARTETLLAALPGSAWWKLLQEYGVGDVTIAPSVTIAPTAPVSFSLAAVESTISALLDGVHAPTPDGNQIYAIYLPAQTKVINTDGSAFCGGAGDAYHESTVGKPKDFAYAVTPHCGSFDGFAVAATHELIEAATDPYPLTTPAWAGTDPGHAGWRGEVGDLCDYGGSLAAAGVEMFGTRVERVFSNAAAAKGGDPCLPSLSLPYFDAAPVPTDDVTIEDLILGNVSGRGVRVNVGKSKAVPLVLYADRALPAWKVRAQALAIGTQQTSSSIKATLDKSTGGPGDVLTLTIERLASGDPYGDVVFLYSSNDSVLWTDTIWVGE